MQVIGLCRFSYPAEGGFQVGHDSPAERADWLYASERMEERFRYFEAFTLPSLRAQTNGNFDLVVVVGDDLPAPYRARLDALLADLPQAQVQAHPPGPHRQVMQAAINAVRKGGRPSLQFRMDDDDAVGVDFVRQLRRTARRLLPELEGNRHIAIDFSRGWIAAPGPEGIMAAPSTQKLTTAALAVAFEPRVALSVMNFSHVRLPKMMKCFHFDDRDMFLRGHSRWNDSRQGPDTKEVALSLLDAAGEARFRTTYGIDADRVRAIFA